MKIENIKKVCVIGAGAMGRQIALNNALYGYETTLTDSIPASLEAAHQFVNQYLNGRVTKGKLTQERVDSALEKLKIMPSLADAAEGADLVIEAIIESLPEKRELFKELDNLTPKHAIFATNSSSIVSSRLADATLRPSQVANLHYFNPVLHMELVEVVQGLHTSEETVEVLMEFCKRTGKTPVLLKKEIDSFIVNRILNAVSSEALFLVDNGIATPQDIDLACEKGASYPMGPFKLQDFVGLDVVYLIRKQRYEDTKDEKQKPSKELEEKVKRGELGRKSGKGWYDYGSNN